MAEDEVECGCCRAMRSRRRCRSIYVEMAGVQYVCFTCRRRPFEEVMDALANGPVYVRGTPYKSIEEMEKAIMVKNK
jgi:hypothetical protein